MWIPRLSLLLYYGDVQMLTGGAYLKNGGTRERK